MTDLTPKQAETLKKLDGLKINGVERPMVCIVNGTPSSQGCKERIVIDASIPEVIFTGISYNDVRRNMVDYQPSLKDMVVAWDFGNGEPLVLAEIY